MIEAGGVDQEGSIEQCSRAPSHRSSIFLIGLALIAATSALRLAWSPDPVGATRLERALPLVAHLVVGCVAYLVGYGTTAVGRGDLDGLLRKLGRRPAAKAAPAGHELGRAPLAPTA